MLVIPFFYQEIRKILLSVSNHLVTCICLKFDRAMSQQSADIVAIYIEQKRYFFSLSFTVR